MQDLRVKTTHRTEGWFPEVGGGEENRRVGKGEQRVQYADCSQ